MTQQPKPPPTKHIRLRGQGFFLGRASGLVSGLRRLWRARRARTRASETGGPPHEVVLVSGIGCSSRLPGYMSTYGFHGVHGRALPVATGIKLVRPELEVIVVGGDGDGYSIGGNHFIHACRRNVDMLYVVMDNRVYGMTKGQPSPTTEADWDSDIAPGGIGLRPFNPLAIAIASGANYVARGFSGDPRPRQSDPRRYSLAGLRIYRGLEPLRYLQAGRI